MGTAENLHIKERKALDFYKEMKKYIADIEYGITVLVSESDVKLLYDNCEYPSSEYDDYTWMFVSEAEDGIIDIELTDNFLYIVEDTGTFENEIKN
jgi:hypothetical protein